MAGSITEWTATGHPRQHLPGVWSADTGGRWTRTCFGISYQPGADERIVGPYHFRLVVDIDNATTAARCALTTRQMIAQTAGPPLFHVSSIRNRDALANCSALQQARCRQVFTRHSDIASNSLSDQQQSTNKHQQTAAYMPESISRRQQ